MTKNLTATTQKIKQFFKKLTKENNFDNYAEFHYIDFDNFLDYKKLAQDILDGNAVDFDTILEARQNSDSEQIEFIYYADAINFLKENDQSLSESLEIAIDEYGFSGKNLNSCILASILATNYVNNNFYDLQDEINEFFQELTI